MAHPHPDQPRRFLEFSHCTLRDVKITCSFWTYCQNFVYGKHAEERNDADAPVGWISASGLYEGLVRIPWNDTNEPQVSVPATCTICARTTDQGIEVDHEGQTLGFCTNRHYVQWWKTLHHAETLDPDQYESPEDRYPQP